MIGGAGICNYESIREVVYEGKRQKRQALAIVIGIL